MCVHFHMQQTTAPESGAIVRRVHQTPSDFHRHRIPEAWLTAQLSTQARSNAHWQLRNAT